MNSGYRYVENRTMLVDYFYVIILTIINVITARPRDKSLSIISQHLTDNSNSPIIIISKSKGHVNQHNALRTTDTKTTVLEQPIQIIEIDKGNSKFVFNKMIRAKENKKVKKEKVDLKEKAYQEAVKERDKKRHIRTENALNYLIQMLQVRNNPIVKDFKEKIKTLETKFKTPLRSKCLTLDCEEQSEEYSQNTNKELYTYFKRHSAYPNRGEKRNRNANKKVLIKIIIDHETETEMVSSNDCDSLSYDCSDKATGSI